MTYGYSMSSQRYNSLFDRIDECARCPICMDRVRNPVPLCDNGYGICFLCRNDQHECPARRIQFSKINPAFLNIMIKCHYQQQSKEMPFDVVLCLRIEGIWRNINFILSWLILICQRYEYTN